MLDAIPIAPAPTLAITPAAGTSFTCFLGKIDNTCLLVLVWNPSSSRRNLSLRDTLVRSAFCVGFSIFSLFVPSPR